MELQSIEIENNQEFDFEVKAIYEHFSIKCFVDAGTHQEEHQQTFEEIETEGLRTHLVVDNVDFTLLEVFNNEGQKISIWNAEMAEAQNDIENAIINLIKE